MPHSFDPARCAEFLNDARLSRVPFENIPEAFSPLNVEEAYIAQAAYNLARHGAGAKPAGLKIATTTRVMQALVGIDHPCHGRIFASEVHESGAEIDSGRWVALKLECEIALRLDAEIPAGSGHTAASVRAFAAAAMPAFELLDDRRSDYRQLKATSLIADNCWNDVVVLGPETPLSGGRGLAGLTGRLNNGSSGNSGSLEGLSDDPFEALAWLANTAGAREPVLRKGMIVITGSIIPTQPVLAGQTYRFEIGGLGSVEMTGR